MVSMISPPDGHDPVNFWTAIHFCLTVDKQQRVASYCIVSSQNSFLIGKSQMTPLAWDARLAVIV